MTAAPPARRPWHAELLLVTALGAFLYWFVMRVNLPGSGIPGMYEIRPNDYLFWITASHDPLHFSASTSTIPHFLFPLLTHLLSLPIPGANDEIRAAGLVSIGAAAGMALAAHALLWGGGRTRYAHAPLRLLATLAVGVAWPATVIAGGDIRYLGYLALNCFHSPTIMLLRPFAFALILVLAWIVERRRGIDGRTLALLGVLVVLATLAKPSFTICLVPGLFVALLVLPAWRSLGTLRSRALLMTVIGLPTVIVLAWQYHVQYGANKRINGDGGIVFAPFDVITAQSRGLGLAHTTLGAIATLALSVLLPLAVVAVAPRRALADPVLQLVWVIFAIALCEGLLFAESGGHRLDGNLLWSAQVVALILWAVSLRTWVAIAAEARGSLVRRAVPISVPAAAIVLQLLSGVEYLADYLRMPPGVPFLT
jgi:hypothetical protein